jgi:hypothetical protein
MADVEFVGCAGCGVPVAWTVEYGDWCRTCHPRGAEAGEPPPRRVDTAASVLAELLASDVFADACSTSVWLRAWRERARARVRPRR